MISVILYGRNDNYGYNLHKRAALSLNCIAEVLTGPGDEILFVDYNTPDDLPTFPEAIQDTLTEKACRMLRIIRVRPHVHERFKRKTRLVALEPIARNAAIRRSNPENRWILSTNTDMIFVPRRAGSLTELARDLPKGFYHAPRLEIPETLWESFDRYDPLGIITKIREWGRTFYLDEIVYGADTILYDGPGDFQLMERSDLFVNQGFNEEMLLGWHVDSNIAKRLFLIYGKVGDFSDSYWGYHCDHTRQITPMHGPTRTENDLRVFVDGVDRPDIPAQADTWGCPNDEIEEVRLDSGTSQRYVGGLGNVIGAPLEKPMLANYTSAEFDKTTFDPRHVLPFLIDMFASLPRNTVVAWQGSGTELLRLFALAWKELGFTTKILCESATLALKDIDNLPITLDSPLELLRHADNFVFEFGQAIGADGAELAETENERVQHAFLRAIRAERERLAKGQSLRRIICVNAINNRYEEIVLAFLAASVTPFSTRMRHGLARLPRANNEDWLPAVFAGPAGVRLQRDSESKGAIAAVAGKLEVLFYGPYRRLDPGAFQLTLTWETIPTGGIAHESCMIIELWSGQDVVAMHLVRRKDLANKKNNIKFQVSERIAYALKPVETRVRIVSPIAITITSLVLESLPQAEAAPTDIPFVLQLPDWLPFMLVGPGGEPSETGVTANMRVNANVVHGPYWPLDAGDYDLIVVFGEPTYDDAEDHILAKIDVFAESQLVAGPFEVSQKMIAADSSLHFPFTIPEELANKACIEMRVYSTGEAIFHLNSIKVARRERV